MASALIGLCDLATAQTTPALQARRIQDGAAGGFADGGILGEYFNNTTFAGSPAFTRRDVRIAFDWGTTNKPGGSRSSDLSAVGLDNYSIRWTGTLLPRFSETYTFHVSAKDSFKLEIRKAGDPAFATVVNLSPSTPTKLTGKLALTAGTKYDIKVSCTALTGSQHALLGWSCPSAPYEVIGPAVQAGVNANTYFGTLWANAVDAGRNFWQGLSQWDPGSGGVAQPAPSIDSNGWPMGEGFGLIIHEIFGNRIQPLMRGPLKMTFSGRASTLFTNGNLTFEDGTTQKDGAGFYNSATNTTTVMLKGIDRGSNIALIGFAGAHRGAAANAAPGITNLKIMCPTRPNSSVNLASGIIFHPLAKAAFSRFTAIRINMNTANREVNWADRTPPSFFNQSGGKINNCPVFYPGDNPDFWRISSGMSWEHQVMFCNETGKDLYINIPHLATDDYMRKVAQLVKYGSDGVNPYSTVQANPVYPPLNSNLKVYVELGNELWNWGSPRDYPAWHTWIPTIRQELSSSAANAKIFNYDNRSTSLDSNNTPVEYFTFFHRRCLLRTLQLSEIFRSVYGSTDLISKVRPLMFGWYNNVFGVDEAVYGFAESYFNNGAGPMVPNPNWNQPARPLNTYVFGGGGGAFYYGSGNANGFAPGLDQGGFETPVVPAGRTQSPIGSPWTFTGPGGYARVAPDSDIPNPFSGQQVAYLNRTAGVNGAMTLQFTLPSTPQTSNVYGLALRAVSRVKTGAAAQDQAAFKVYVNGASVTAGQNWLQDGAGAWQEVGMTPSGWSAGSPWFTRQGWFYADLHFYTRSFTALPGAAITIRIESTAVTDDQMVYIDDVRLTSVDAVYAGGIPGSGQAFGQVTNGTYDFELFGQSNWAQAMGLAYMTYEGGWSLGGDNGGSYVQNWAKYKDNRAAQTVVDSLRSFHRGGGFLPTFGTYDQWPTFDEQLYEEGMVDTALYPLPQGIDRSLGSLPTESENGSPIPAVLRPATSHLTLPTADAGRSAPTANGGWMMWNVLAPKTADYRIDVDATAGGTMRLVVNGSTLWEGPGGKTSQLVNLGRGLNNIRVLAKATGFSVNSVSVSMAAAPQPPVISSIEEASGSATIRWAGYKGPSGYIVRYGDQEGRLNNIRDVGASLSAQLTGLVHGRTYFVEVLAYNSQGTSLPSPVRSFVSLTDGLAGPLASWDFTGAPLDLAAPAATAASSRLTLTTLQRGSGLRDPADAWQNCLQVYPSTGDSWGQTPAEGFNRNEWLEFTVTPKAGTKMSLDSLSLWAAAQRANTGGVSVSYRIGAGAFSSPVSIGAFASDDERRKFSLNLSSIAALQNTSSAVTFRISLYGNQQWCWAFFGLDADTPANRAQPENRADVELVGKLGAG